MTDWNFTISILALEIQRQEQLNRPDAPEIAELKKVIRILREGQGYLTKAMPKRMVFFKEL